jgi:predicted transcriptional regulator
MVKQIQLAKGYALPVSQYATQGNAILGIRESGKSYTAMKVAEQLMEAGIPIIAFDPVGIWRFLKVPANANGKGYPVVVAGGNEPDIPITVKTAPDIIRAAMKEGVSLVIDLYCMELSAKSVWRKIVQDAINILMYENKSYGPRHIFLEEAAEFIPQRLGPAHGLVYAEIEKLARMGRNASLGYTLVNQRAEEVNKAILEICALSMLHKQVGKNSMLSLKKWFDVLHIESTDNVMKSLAGLEKGECWIVGETAQPTRIKVLPRTSYHPNPSSPIDMPSQMTKAVDPGKFIQKMQKHLNKNEEKPTVKEKVFGKSQDIFGVEKMKETIKSQSLRIDTLTRLNTELLKDNVKYRDKLSKIKALTDPLPEITVASNGPLYPRFSPPTSSVISVTSKSGEKRILNVIAMHHPKAVNKTRVATLANLSPTSGSFGTYIATLKREGMIVVTGSVFNITTRGLAYNGTPEQLPEGKDLLEMWCANIGAGSGASRILRYLYERNDYIGKGEVAENVGLSSTSGSFGTYIATLKRNGLIIVTGSAMKISDDFLN